MIFNTLSTYVGNVVYMVYERLRLMAAIYNKHSPHFYCSYGRCALLANATFQKCGRHTINLIDLFYYDFVINFITKVLLWFLMYDVTS
jgi:hypothetical protein